MNEENENDNPGIFDGQGSCYLALQDYEQAITV